MATANGIKYPTTRAAGDQEAQRSLDHLRGTVVRAIMVLLDAAGAVRREGLSVVSFERIAMALDRMIRDFARYRVVEESAIMPEAARRLPMVAKELREEQRTIRKLLDELRGAVEELETGKSRSGSVAELLRLCDDASELIMKHLREGAEVHHVLCEGIIDD
jgi:hypothetical protein